MTSTQPLRLPPVSEEVKDRIRFALGRLARTQFLIASGASPAWVTEEIDRLVTLLVSSFRLDEAADPRVPPPAFFAGGKAKDDYLDAFIAAEPSEVDGPFMPEGAESVE